VQVTFEPLKGFDRKAAGGVRGVQHTDVAIERFVGLENVKRFRRLLETVSDDTERATLV